MFARSLPPAEHPQGLKAPAKLGVLQRRPPFDRGDLGGAERASFHRSAWQVPTGGVPLAGQLHGPHPAHQVPNVLHSCKSSICIADGMAWIWISQPLQHSSAEFWPQGSQGRFNLQPTE